MFSGLVTHIGIVRSHVKHDGGSRLWIQSDLQSLVIGDSIAVNGVCLTVAELPQAPRGYSNEPTPSSSRRSAVQSGAFIADASSETLAHTTLSQLKAADSVHLERALRVGDRIGGHIVTGHVDGVVTLCTKRAVAAGCEHTYEAPAALSRFLAPKGSVAVDGVSLTTNRVQGRRFEVMLVPHTCSVTHLNKAKPGARLNLEVDVLAKYVAHLLDQPDVIGSSRGSKISLDMLRQAGFTGDLYGD